jgi:LmbE family N-acetylglucosaminyl deacetylase
MTNNRVLALMAHPDDAEFLCAGTLARLGGKGYQIHLATMTAGDGGSRELSPEEIARVRLAEAAASAALLGASYHCAGVCDFFILYDAPTLRQTIELVRQIDPFLVITHSPADYMVDHEMTSRLVRTACFAAPVPNLKTQSPPVAGVPYLYYADALEGKDILGQPIVAGFYIDISETIEIKERMLACHASQREWLLAQHGLDHYLESMKEWSAQRGAEAGVKYAEAFRQHLGHAYPQENKLAEILGAITRS